MFTIEPKHTRVREKWHNEFLEQDGLEIVFKCEDGEQRASRFVLTYLSEFYDDQLAARDRKNQPPVFNYPFSTECVKSFLYYIHGLPVESVSVSIMVELLKFAKFDGIDKMDKMVAALLEELCQKLVEANLSNETKLMICLVCSSIKDFEPDFDKKFFRDCTFDALKLTCFDIDLTSKENIHLKKLLTVGGNNKKIEFDDYIIQSMIFEMVKKMNVLSQTITKQIPSKLPPYDVNLKATIIVDKISEEMKQYAITLAHDSYAKYSVCNDVAKNMAKGFQDKFGDGTWHCIIGINNCDGFFYTHNTGMFIRFNVEKNQKAGGIIDLWRKG